MYTMAGFEEEYLRLGREIIQDGYEQIGRNGKTKCILDRQLKADMRGGLFPILTMRHQFWRGIVEELLWIMRGSTDANELHKRGVKIWDANTTPEAIQRAGLDYESGTIGPGYGWQMRRYGERFLYYPKGTRELSYTSGYVRGDDQLKNVIYELIKNPTSRRMIISLWNPNQTQDMVLPPCHMTYQFNVLGDTLYCHLYQRSWDIALGWNMQTAALLTALLARMCGYKPGVVTHTISNLHIYEEHLSIMTDVVKQPIHQPPQLDLSAVPLYNLDMNLDVYLQSLEADMFVLKDYKYNTEKFKLKMIA
jgi:thymidylate synthase